MVNRGGKINEKGREAGVRGGEGRGSMVDRD